MILVTVGTELPFDRLIRAVDQWAEARGRSDVFAQIGEGSYLPTWIGYRRFLDAPEFRRRFSGARLIVSHAGMGTILTALSSGKPILVMPRSAALNEHRNDHQQATARHLLQTGQVEVAFDVHQLAEKLEGIDQLKPATPIPAFADHDLIRTLGAFIHERSGPARNSSVEGTRSSLGLVRQALNLTRSSGSR